MPCAVFSLLFIRREPTGNASTLEVAKAIDVNAAVRTIVSRWNGGKTNVESFGWSLGVTGEKSRFKFGPDFVAVSRDHRAERDGDVVAVRA